MPDFTQYKREDFLADESFFNYLLHKNASDIQFWRDWIRNHPECRQEVKEARLLFFLLTEEEVTRHSKSKVETDQQYAKLQTLLKENNSETDNDIILLPIKEIIATKPFFTGMLWKAASVAAIFLIVLYGWIYFGAANRERSKYVFVPFAKTDSTGKEITLPDGSHVQLNRYSAVEITKEYNGKKREVLLSGSAFFNVYKDHSRPFIVITGRVKTTALGTSFYIYSLHPQSVSVSLLNGKVRVEGTENFVELWPGEKAVADSGQRIFKDSFDTNQLFNFTNGKIQFDHADLQEIKTVLEEYFNKEVLIEGDAPKLNFRGSFDAKKIKPILEALQFTYNIKYKSEGQKIIISFN